MLENLRSLAQPHGGDLFLLLIALAVISLAVLFNIRKRLACKPWLNGLLSKPVPSWAS